MGAKFDLYIIICSFFKENMFDGNKSVALESMVRKIHVKNSILQY